MNRFQVTPCVHQSEINEEPSGGMVLPLASEIMNNCILFFPVSDDVATAINVLLEREEATPKELSFIGVFKTMVKTWRSGDRFLSGILLDSIYDTDLDEETLQAHIVISSINDGYVESVSKINFVHAMIISVLENVDVMVSNELIAKLIPDIFGEDEFDDDQFHEDPEDLELPESFPVDKDILKIVKKIMDGKIK